MINNEFDSPANKRRSWFNVLADDATIASRRTTEISERCFIDIHPTLEGISALYSDTEWEVCVSVYVFVYGAMRCLLFSSQFTPLHLHSLSIVISLPRFPNNICFITPPPSTVLLPPIRRRHGVIRNCVFLYLTRLNAHR